MKTFTSVSLSLLVFTSILSTIVKGDQVNFNVSFYENLFEHGILKRLALYLEHDSSYNYLQCSKDIVRWLKSTDGWALQMHDANGKLPSGILQGHLHTLGSYDECLAVYNKTQKSEIKGKYCFAKLPLIGVGSSRTVKNIHPVNAVKTPMNDSERGTNIDQYSRIAFNWAVCIPSSCAAEEIQKMLRDLLISVNVTLGNPLITVPENHCSTNEKIEWTGGEIAAVTVLSIFALLMVASTIYDVLTRNHDEDTKAHNILIAFSMYTNSKNLFKTTKSSSTLKCLNGIRAISMFWIIIGHRYTTVLMTPLINSLSIIEWVKTPHSTMISAGSVSVDTFFVLSGLLLSYIFFNQMHDKKSFNLPLFYLHRLIRLWPAMAMTIFVHSTIYSRLGNGPYWPVNIEAMVYQCYDYWWSALLYVQNYVNPMVQCVGQLWYICCDMQLYILSPILLYPLLIKPKFGIANMIFWIVLSQITVTAISYSYDLGSSITAGFGENGADYMIKYYVATHARATPWLLGFAAGYFLQRTANKKIKINAVLVILYWAVALAIMSAIIFGSRNLQDFSRKSSVLEDASYNAFSRTGWAIGVIMVILACVKGYGGIYNLQKYDRYILILGPVNWFLSLNIWQILARFTYSMYLLHFGMQFWQLSTKRVTGEFSHFQLIYTFCGDLVFSVFCAYLWIMAFESPFLVLEKVLLTKPKSRPNIAVSVTEQKNDMS